MQKFRTKNAKSVYQQYERTENMKTMKMLNLMVERK